MNRRTLTIFGCALAMALTLALSSCGMGVNKSLEPKATVTIDIAGVNPNIYRALGEASVASGSRAYMFLTKYDVSVIGTNDRMSYYNNTITTNTTNPGGGSNFLNLSLPADASYDISIYGYNTGESQGSIMYGSVYNRYIPAGTTNYEISVTLIPNGNYMYSTPGTTSGECTIAQSVYDQALNGGNGGFPTIGGEKWFYFYPSSNTASVTVTPTSGFVYAAMYDSSGRTLAGGVSPSFGGGTGSSAVTLDSGVTANNAVYVGYIDIAGGATAGTDTVNLTINTSSLGTDDPYEDNDTPGYETLIDVSGITAAAPVVFTGLTAYDIDGYRFYAPLDGFYTVTVTDNYPSYDVSTSTYFSSGSLEVQGADGSRSSDWDTWHNDHMLHGPTFTASQPVPAGYNINVVVNLQHLVLPYGFNVPAAGYTMTISYTPQP